MEENNIQDNSVKPENDNKAAELFGFDKNDSPIKTPYNKSLYHTSQNLDLNKKAESRRNFSGGGRDTGHFGTGYYAFGNNDYADKYAKYRNRNIYEIDASKYNLYRPKDDSDGRKFHSDLSKLNNFYIGNLDKNGNAMRNDFVNNLPNDDDKQNYQSYVNNYIKKYFDKDKDYKVYRDIENYFANNQYGGPEYMLNKIWDKYIDVNDELNDSIINLSNRFDVPVEKAKQMVYNAIKNKDNYDSPSTQFMKGLGYEGIDVSGIEGLDDEEFGSVVYDLKPNTYRELKSEV